MGFSASATFGGAIPKDGDRLDGSRNYRLHVPPNVPMKQFWAATIYDADTRTLFQNETTVAEVPTRRGS